MSEVIVPYIDISVVIVNYNLAREIENCLDSLLPHITKFNYEIIVVDNNSPERDILQTENKYSANNIHFYFLNENKGFGQGCNYGVKKASGKYIWFLNPDTIIVESIFEKVKEIFEEDNTIGIVGPRQQIKLSVFDFSAGFCPNVFLELFYIFFIGAYIESFIIFIYTHILRKEYYRVGWILGACIFIKTDLFRQMKGFDKDYFMFYEEVDLCHRVAEKGYKIIYSPKIKINHIGSVSGKKDYYLFTKRIYTSKGIYISKHFKSLYKFGMNILLRGQIYSQLFLWIIIYPINKQKAHSKIKALTDVLSI